VAKYLHCPAEGPRPDRLRDSPLDRHCRWHDRRSVSDLEARALTQDAGKRRVINRAHDRPPYHRKFGERGSIRGRGRPGALCCALLASRGASHLIVDEILGAYDANFGHHSEKLRQRYGSRKGDGPLLYALEESPAPRDCPGRRIFCGSRHFGTRRRRSVKALVDIGSGGQK